MNRPTLSRALLALAFAAPLCAQAAPLGTKPGAWETTITVVYHDIPIIDKELSNLSPEKRAQRIKDIKSHEGKPETGITRHCVKASDTMDKLIESHPEKDGCTRKLIHKTATSIEVTADCTRPAPSKARIKVVAKSKVNVLTTIDAEYDNGMKMHKEADSRWIGPSCEGLHPLPPGAEPRPTH